MKRYLFWLWIVGAFVVLLQRNQRLSDLLHEAQQLSNATSLESAEYRTAADEARCESLVLLSRVAELERRIAAKCKAGK